MRRPSIIAHALRALLCLALVLPGAAGLSAAPAADGENWLVICGAEGTYSVPAPDAPPAPGHADCALCAVGCGHGCGLARAPENGGITFPGAGESARTPIDGEDAFWSRVGFASRPRGPPAPLPA